MKAISVYYLFSGGDKNKQTQAAGNMKINISYEKKAVLSYNFPPVAYYSLLSDT